MNVSFLTKSQNT